MSTIGELLKKTRIERGLTLEQAAHVTRVRLHYLRALEEDQREVMPSLVQGRGYLRLYADYLKLDVQRLLDAWESNLLVDEEQPAEALPVPDLPEEVPAEPVAVVQEAPEPEPEFEPAPEPVSPQRKVIVTPPIDLAAPSEPEKASQAVFVEIGQRLRNQREALGITLADVEKFTHVRQHYIQALEGGLLDQLPSPVQGRGMLSNYARFLNLDADGLLLRFAEGLQLRREERTEGTIVVNPRQASPRRAADPVASQKPVKSAVLRRILSPDLIIGGGLLIVMVIFFVWGASRLDLGGSETTDLTITAPSISEMLAITATPSPPAGAITDTPQPPVEGGLPVDIAVSTVVGTQVNTDPLQVYVIARQRAWVKITIDGKVAFQGRVLPGNAYTYSGSDRVELLTGNAGALQVFFNQNDLGTLGAAGQVGSLVFTSDGVITPTAAFSATPTITLLPTLTLFPTPTRPTPTITPFIP